MNCAMPEENGRLRFQSSMWIGVTNGYASFPEKAEGAEKATYFRKEFEVEKGLVSAELAVTGLGYYQLFINGKRPDCRVLMPLFTNYLKRVLYDVSDITDQLTEGNNCIGIVLGNGYYLGICDDTWEYRYAAWKAFTRLIFELVLTYSDGHQTVIGSDGSVKATADGGIIFNVLRNGEYYDRRREQKGWALPGFDDTAWTNALINAPAGMLYRRTAPAVVEYETLPVRETKILDNGNLLLDFGTGVTGFCKISGSAPCGTKLKIVYGEVLNDTGHLYNNQLQFLVHSGEFQTDQYTFGGEEKEEWSPSFTFHGFRYAEVSFDRSEAVGDTPESIAFEAIRIGSDLPKRYTFSCSEPSLNTLDAITDISDRNNFVGLPLDCPHREKNPWLSEGLLSAERILYDHDSASAYDKWLDDFCDAQLDNGQIPCIAPNPGYYGYTWGNGITYECALLFIAWNIYRETGSDASIRRIYPNALRTMHYHENFLTENDTVEWGLFDWLSVDIWNPCPTYITSTSYFYRCCVLISRFASIMNDRETQDRYTALGEKVKTSFNEKFVDRETGKIGTSPDGEETAQCVPLYYGLITDENIPAVMSYLKKAIADRNGHISTGTYGTHCILEALTKYGAPLTAFDMVMAKGYPGWQFMLEKGATTLWEMWNAGRDAEWYGSLDHSVYGSVGEWLHCHLAGLSQTEESIAYRHILFAPLLMLPVTYAECTKTLPTGDIFIRWEKKGKEITLDVTVPAGSDAVLRLPAGYTAVNAPAVLAPGTYRFPVSKS